MRRFVFLFLLAALMAGCASPGTQEVPFTPAPTVEATERPSVTPTDPDPSPTASGPEPTLEPTASPEPSPTAEVAPLRIAYTGPDGNLWLLDPITGEGEQLTQDAANPSTDNPAEAVQYCCAQWTTDRSLLAYRRDVGTPVSDGYHYRFELWVYDAAAGEHRQVFEDMMIFGLSWKPLTHLLTYGLPIDPDYFNFRQGGVSAEKAGGIWAIDLDRGEPIELVAPSRGYSLANPKWSRDGRFLSFEEILYYEGRGNFAYFDFEAQEYVAWERAIGAYDWTPDSRQIVYDDLTYAPSGTERVYLSDRMGEGEQEISLPIEMGYASSPALSPAGDQVAYLVETGGPESGGFTLFVQPFPEGEARSLGEFEQAGDLAWLPDGSGLILSAGEWGFRQVLRVAFPGGEVTVLADGYQPRLPLLLP
jgi:hypothetical protein